MPPRQPLLARFNGCPQHGVPGWYRSWWWSPGGRNKDKAKRRSARRERSRARNAIREGDG